MCIIYSVITLIQKAYERFVLDHPHRTIFIIFLITCFFGYYTPDFRLDASSESLSLEEDKALSTLLIRQLIVPALLGENQFRERYGWSLECSGLFL